MRRSARARRYVRSCARGCSGADLCLRRRGIAHSERTPGPERASGHRLHGIQVWVALPQEAEETEPSFHHHEAGVLPLIERDGVTIMAPTNLPATVPVHASQLYSRNLTSFLSPLIKDGQLQLDMNDDVVGPSCVTHNGEVVNQRVAAALQAQPG